MRRQRPKEPPAVEFVDIPDEQRPAINVGWMRAQTIARAYGFAPFVIEAFKPVLVSIYMQGCVDGYGASQHEK